jgi:alpha-glucosidase
MLNCNNTPYELNGDKHSLRSPNDELLLQFWLESDGEPMYQLFKGQQTVIEPSSLGVELDEYSLSGGFELGAVLVYSADDTWEQPWGEQRFIRDQHSGLEVELKLPDQDIGMKLHFRLFDDGLGFRYEWDEDNSGLTDFVIKNEKTEFNLPADHTAWWIKAYIPNRYEHLFTESPVSEMDTVHTPLTMKSDDGLYISIHEAALTDYSAMSIINRGNNKLEATLFPWMDGSGDKVRASTPFVSPWRTIKVSEDPGGLVTNYIDLNLNEPSKIEDTSWIKPAKYVGIWWDMHLETKSWASGPKHGATTEYTKEWIDFAAEHGFDGVLVEGWNTGWDGDWTKNANAFSFTESYPDYDLPYLTEYAQSKGTNIIMHNETSTGIENYESQMDEAYQLYEDLGIHAIKSGYVGDMIHNGEWHHGQYMVRHYRTSIEKAAEHKIMLDIHEPIKDTGIRRTWPNVMTREGARGQEYHAWSVDGGNPPDYIPTIVFTRMLSGPFDYTPGVLDIMMHDNRKERRATNRIRHTQAKELALYVVIYSPMHMAADLMKNYKTFSGAFQFIKEVPVDWETTRVLNAEIGDYVTIVRKDRNSDDWYLGSVTNEEARTLSIELDFLEAGRTYTAMMYVDGEKASYEENPYDLDLIKKEVKKGDELELKLATSGGAAIRFVAD